jgi:hypothetical protein
MAGGPRAIRIVFLSLAIAALAAIGVFFATQSSRPPPAPQPVVCQPLPSNIKTIGPALAARDAAEVFDEDDEYSVTLKAAIRPGDRVHSFETETTGGYLVLRDKCFVGQSVSWIR